MCFVFSFFLSFVPFRISFFFSFFFLNGLKFNPSSDPCLAQCDKWFNSQFKGARIFVFCFFFFAYTCELCAVRDVLVHCYSFNTKTTQYFVGCVSVMKLANCSRRTLLLYIVMCDQCCCCFFSCAFASSRREKKMNILSVSIKSKTCFYFNTHFANGFYSVI